jgi:hypothetical protein
MSVLRFSSYHPLWRYIADAQALQDRRGAAYFLFLQLLHHADDRVGRLNLQPHGPAIVDQVVLDVDVHLLVALALAGNVLRADDFLEPCCVPFPCTVLRQGVFFYTVQLFAILLMATLGFDIIYSSN